jgi:hypothetical protein
MTGAREVKSLIRLVAWPRKQAHFLHCEAGSFPSKAHIKGYRHRLEYLCSNASSPEVAMRKNIIIAGVVFLNVVLLTALIFLALKWRRSVQPTTNPGSVASAPDNAAETIPQEFVYHAPGRFVGDSAPPIVDRALTIAATFDTQDQNGVIVAQGGLAHGYTLYVQDGELLFALRRANVLTTVSGGKISAGRHTAQAVLTKTGEISVELDGKSTATGRAAGVITLQPVDGLDIGADRGAPVGPYQIPNQFGGAIEVVSLKTTP